MAEVKISQERLDELEQFEEVLKALEAGGVSEWEWYEDCINTFRTQRNLRENRKQLLYELEAVFAECAYEPSERGAGLSFTEEAYTNAMQVLEKFNVKFDVKED